MVGILAHVDSGKTTLSEAMLYSAGAIKKLGRVDHGDSFLDTNVIERERGITVFSKQAQLYAGETAFTLLDTPGHADFSAETERTLQVLDYAILVISGSDGVQSHTMTLWKLLKRYGVPCFVFVNKMDLAGADKRLLMEQLRQRFGEECVDFGSAEDNAFYENLAMCDEGLLEQFDSTGSLTRAAVIDAIQKRKVFPCLFGSALRLEGIEAFLHCLDVYTAMPDYGSAFAARVFKIAEDKQKNRLTFMKITGGSLHVRDVPESSRNKDGEKVHQIRLYSGEKFTAEEQAPAGTVCAVTGLNFTRCGDGLGAESGIQTPALQPVLTYTVELPTQMAAHTALEKLRRLEEEDPQLHISWDDSSKSIQLRLMGEIQLEILKRLIAERFGFAVSFGKGSIIYKETIENTVEGIGHFEPLRHYAEVHLLMKPAPPGSGLVFRSECREELLDRNRQRLILAMLYEHQHIGVLTGSPITDMEIVLAAGKDHVKHTVGGDFREAACRAVRQGLRSAKSVLLEPVYDFTIELPSENAGRAAADIQRMCGRFDPPETLGDRTLICGTAPVSEMSEYGAELVQYTRGSGKLVCTFGGYEPCHNSEQVIAAIGYDADADTDHPCDSVFCSHGAGYIVKWNQVREHMHISSVLREKVPVDPQTRLQSSARRGGDFFASDKELMQIFEQTYGPVRQRRAAERREYHYTASQENDKGRKKAPVYTGPEYLLVDGYNVIFAWEELKQLAQTNLDAARTRLINLLCNYRGYKKCELILVFDAYKVRGGQRAVEEYGGIHIVYTKEAETADMYIEKTTHALAPKYRVRVVTSDGAEQLIILGNGALRVSSASFLTEVRQAEQEIREIIDQFDT